VNKALVEAKDFPVMPISILLFDINMPKKNGIDSLVEVLDFYENLKVPEGVPKENFIKKPYVIMMSSFSIPSIIKHAKEKGASQYFSSPLCK
jgi:DNA-binding NarL/FixJ family response regulator